MAQIRTDTKVVHHIDDGAKEVYAVDAHSAVARHPLEWSFTPWDPEAAAANRAKLHEMRVAVAREEGRPEPEPPVEPELTDEERELLAAHRARVAEAKELLAVAEAEEAEKRDREAKIADAKAVLASSGPQIAPRKPLAGAAKAAAERAAAKRAEAEAEAEAQAQAKAQAKAEKSAEKPAKE